MAPLVLFRSPTQSARDYRNTWNTLTDKRGIVSTKRRFWGLIHDSYWINADTRIVFKRGKLVTIWLGERKMFRYTGNDVMSPAGFEQIMRAGQ